MRYTLGVTGDGEPEELLIVDHKRNRIIGRSAMISRKDLQELLDYANSSITCKESMPPCPLCCGSGQAYYIDDKHVAIIQNTPKADLDTYERKKCPCCMGEGISPLPAECE